MRAIILAGLALAAPAQAESVFAMRSREPVSSFETSRDPTGIIECMMLATDTKRKHVESQLSKGGTTYLFPIKAGPLMMKQGLAVDVLDGSPVRVAIYTFKRFKAKIYGATVAKMETCR